MFIRLEPPRCTRPQALHRHSGVAPSETSAVDGEVPIAMESCVGADELFFFFAIILRLSTHSSLQRLETRGKTNSSQADHAVQCAQRVFA